jgi:hypothetical protein
MLNKCNTTRGLNRDRVNNKRTRTPLATDNEKIGNKRAREQSATWNGGENNNCVRVNGNNSEHVVRKGLYFL